MTSAAQYLLDFFTGTEQKRSFRVLYDATCELEDELTALALLGTKVQPYLDLIPRIRGVLNQNADSELSEMVNTRNGPIRLESRDAALLELAVERTAMSSEMNPDREETLRELFAEVRRLVTKDETLDPQLRLFIVRAILAAENSLDEYSITGEFSLREALVYLFGLLRTAEASSGEPSKWHDAWEKYGVPAAAGLIASIPQLALTGATVLQALGS
ncbi:hypothetical protein [Microbacterium maritypicum]